MNMDSYGKFYKLFLFLATDENTESMPASVYYNKKKYYDKIGIKTEEEKQTMEKQRNTMMLANIKSGLENSHYFEIDKIQKRLLLLTDAPKDSQILKKVRMPFPSIFIDINIDGSEIDTNIDFDEADGILVTEINNNGSKMLYLAFSGRKENTAFINDFLIPIEMEKNLNIHYHDKKDLKFFRNFIINFLLFINNPDIELIEIKRSKKNEERRKKKGQIPMPSSSKIKLVGKIKKYAENIGSHLSGDGFNFRFWVRGHWRIFQNTKYKNAKGKIIWIEPFMKGKGLIKEKSYKIVPKKEHTKEYKDNFLFLDDIEVKK